VAAARKTPRRTIPAKTGAKHKGAKPRPVETPQLLTESDASQTLQSDKLRRTQLELEAARDRYAKLYDFSPAGYLTLDTSGTIVEANLRAGTLLGINRKELIRQPLARFIASDDQDIFHRHCQDVLKTGMRQTCEVHLRKNAGASCCVYFESLAVHEETGHITHWRTALLDVSDRKRAEQKLATQEAQLEGIIASAMDAIITVDEGERVLLFNRAAESMFLCQGSDAIGQPFDRFIPERFRQAHHGHMSLFARTQATSRSMGRSGELFGLRANGEEFPLEASISYVRVEDKTLMTVILRDVTERKKAEEMLQASDTFTRAVLNSLLTHVCVLDKEGVILETNDAWREFARQQADGQFIIGEPGKNYLDLCRHTIAAGTSTGQAILKGIEAVLTREQPSFTVEYCAALPEEERWFLMRVAPLKESQGVVISHRDISERVRIAQTLEDHMLLLEEKHEELESLTGKLIEAQEEERKRIARDLHDDFNQRLAALSVELESMERIPIAPPKPVARQLVAIRVQVGRLSDDLHELAYRLHPSLLEHVGLEVAARDHVAEFTKRTGLPVRFIAHEVPGTLSPEIATNLFRVMQESLQNVSKHAQATEVTVRLSGSSKGIGISVRDNGKGFDLESKNVRVRGLGLVSMQERARGLGGFLRIHSLARDGTKVCAWIPRSPEGA
jgi:PAS domain S-box-containing protein